MSKALPIVLSLVLGAASAASAGQIHAREGVAGQVKTPEGRFFQGLYGGPAQDRLGIALPAVLPAAVITRLVLPATEGAKPTIVGAKAWPGRPDRYVAIVCMGGDETWTELKLCMRDNFKSSPRIYLGVVSAAPGAAPALIARSGEVDTSVSWAKSGLPGRPSLRDDAQQRKIDNGEPIAMRQFGSFDLAHYEIAPGEIAFGLRGAWEEDVSGGGNYQTGLLLFVVDGDRLKRVLAVPMSFYSDDAGDWHADGTRDHFVVDEDNKLVILKTSTNGHYDLALKSTTGRTRLFRWSAEASNYRPAEN